MKQVRWFSVSRWPACLLVVTVFICSVNSIALDEEADELLQDILNKYEENPQDARFQHVIEIPHEKSHLFPKVFIWCPVTRFQLDLQCPVHNVPLKLGRWMGNLREESSDNPRLVYDIGGNILLVQRHYSCGRHLEGTRGNGHRYMSGAAEVLAVLPRQIQQSLPIELHFKSALSKNLLDYVLVQVQQGINFVRICQGIGSLNFRKYVAHQINRPNNQLTSEELENNFYDDVLYSFPSNDKLMHLFLNYFDKVKDFLEQDMRSHIGNILICDHTFQIASHIGDRVSKKDPSEGQFDRAFIGLNEFGEVMFLRLTRDTGFEQIEDLLEDFKMRLVNEGMQLQLILVEDCCVAQERFRQIFGDIPVKLSPFHATQRILQTIHPTFQDTKKFLKEFRMIFRQKGDTNEERNENTAPGDVISENLEQFMTRWGTKLTDKTVECIHDLREHIDRGCLSDIPPGDGTERNERLHEFLTDSLLCAAKTLSPELAIAILAYVLYVWNCQRKGRKHSSNSRVVPTIPVECKQNLGSARFYDSCLKANGKLDGELMWGKAAELGIHRFIQVEFEAVGDVACLENENLVKYAITRALHLQEIFHLLKRKSDKRNFNVVDFPYYLVKGYSFLLRCQSGQTVTYDLEKKENLESLQRNLASFGLERSVVPSDGNCCFSSIISQLHKVKNADSGKTEYSAFLEQLGLCKTLEEDTATLRGLFLKEVTENLDTYKKWINLPDGDIQYEINQFAKDGFFSSDIGDLCVMVCSRILQTPIVVITSYSHAPYLPFLPEKLSSSLPLFIAFDHSPPGHYDSTKELPAGPGRHPPMRCCCGRSRKGDKADQKSCTEADQGQSKCPCFRMNVPCTRNCRCKNCQNPSLNIERKFQSKKNRKSCMCGNGRKTDLASYIACKDNDHRKSKCPCLRDSLGCTSDCRCRNCGNIFNSGDDIPGKRGPESLTGKVKRRRSNPQSYKRMKGAEFVTNQDTKPLTESWTELETIMLLVIEEILFLTNLPQESTNIVSLYQFIASSEFVSELGLPLRAKEPPEIDNKLLEMLVKQQLFLSVLNPDIAVSTEAVPAGLPAGTVAMEAVPEETIEAVSTETEAAAAMVTTKVVPEEGASTEAAIEESVRAVAVSTGTVTSEPMITETVVNGTQG